MPSSALSARIASRVERILGVINRHAHERFHAFAHQPGIGAKDEYNRPIGTGEELLDLGDLQRDHEISIAVTSRLAVRGAGIITC
jgi:hypothetical protein